MNTKLIGLAFIAIMLTALFFVQDSNESRESNRVFPEMTAGLSELSSVTLVSLSEEGGEVTLNRPGKTWTVAQKSDYPANFEALSAFLVALSELEIAEVKTAKAVNHARLGVADIGDSAAILVHLEPGDFELMIGNSGGSHGSFIRFPGESQVYLTRQQITASVDPIDWLDPVLVNVDSAEVDKVSLATQSAQFLAAIRNADTGNLELQNQPVDRELKYATIVDNLSRLLVNLRFIDVQPHDPALFNGTSLANITLISGEVIKVATMKQDDGYWLHMNREATNEWQYKISEYSFNEFNKTMDDMLRPQDEQ